MRLNYEPTASQFCEAAEQFLLNREVYRTVQRSVSFEKGIHLKLSANEVYYAAFH